jgi:hypothetical protein
MFRKYPAALKAIRIEYTRVNGECEAVYLFPYGSFYPVPVIEIVVQKK